MINPIDELKKLKSIKADEGFRFDLRKKILRELDGAVTKQSSGRLFNQRMSIAPYLLIILFLRKKMFIPLLLVAALLGTGAGTTYASQNSLPGDVLYPIKIIAEKAQTALVFNNVKEAELYSKFASKRLEEIEKLAEAEKINLELAQKAVDYYKKDLSASQNILNAAPTSDQSAQIAKAISIAASQNKIIMINISKKIKKGKNDKVYDILKDAWEEAEEHDDKIAMALLANFHISDDIQFSPLTVIDLSNNANTTTAETATNTTNSTNTGANLLAQNNVLRKIAEANHKISEAEKYIAKKELQGVDVSAAKTQIASAKTLVVEAQNLLNQSKYQEAFLKAKEAHQTAKLAKKSVEQKTKDHDDKYSDEEDDEEIFVIPTLNDIYGDNNDDDDYDDDYFGKEIKDKKEKHGNKGRKDEDDD